MAANWIEEIQGFGSGLSVDEGIAVHNFEEYTFHAPRPGFFLGDSPAPNGELNPVVHLEEVNSSARIPRCRPSRPYLGKLDILATELLHLIFVHLDLCSLPALRRINQHAEGTINNFLPFRTIAAFPKLLGAVEAFQCHSWSVEALMRCVLDDRCSVCGHFGDFMYLATPERWCYKCFLGGERLVVQRIASFRMSQDEEALQTCQHVPNVRLSVGYYGFRAKAVLGRPILVFDLRELQLTFPAAASWPHAYVGRSHSLRYTTIIRAPYWDIHTGVSKRDSSSEPAPRKAGLIGAVTA